MIPSKPRLIVTEERHPAGLGSVTWEKRQGYRDRNGARIEERAGLGMTAAELIKLMGPLHVHHPDYKERQHPLVPMPNLAGIQPTISLTEYGILAQWKALLRWAMR